MHRPMFSFSRGVGLAAMMAGPIHMGGGALKPKGPKIPYGEFLDLKERGRKYKQKVQARIRARRRQEHSSNRLANLRGKAFYRDHSARAFDDAVNKMTNWGRHQWHKAKYPGFHGKDMDLLEPFIGTAARRVRHGRTQPAV